MQNMTVCISKVGLETNIFIIIYVKFDERPITKNVGKRRRNSNCHNLVDKIL